MSSPIAQGFVDPGVQFVDHHWRFAWIAFKGRTQDVVDVGD